MIQNVLTATHLARYTQRSRHVSHRSIRYFRPVHQFIYPNYRKRAQSGYLWCVKYYHGDMHYWEKKYGLGDQNGQVGREGDNLMDTGGKADYAEGNGNDLKDCDNNDVKGVDKSNVKDSDERNVKSSDENNVKHDIQKQEVKGEDLETKKSLDTSIDKRVYPISASTLLMGTAIGVIIPVMPIYCAEMDISPSQFGLLISVMGFTRLLVNIPLASLGDIFGRRPLLIFGPV